VDAEKSQMKEIRKELMMAHFRERKEKKRSYIFFFLLNISRKWKLRWVHNKFNVKNNNSDVS
jgi:hypothetical protein